MYNYGPVADVLTGEAAIILHGWAEASYARSNDNAAEGPWRSDVLVPSA